MESLNEIRSGIFSHGGARLFLDNLRLAYSRDILEVESDQGIARYTTQHNGDFFAMSMDFQGCDRFNSAGDIRSWSTPADFDLISQNGIRYRVFAQLGSSTQENVPAACQIYILPDHPALEIQHRPFVVSNLPETGHLYYLLLAKPPEQAFTLAEVKDLCTKFLRQSENGPGWITSLPQTGFLGPNTEKNFEIILDTLGLDPGEHTTRYAIGGLETTRDEIPGEKWNDIQVQISPPDFKLNSPVLTTAIPTGGIQTILPVQVDPLGGPDLTFTNLETSEPWASVSASTSQPNSIELDINADDLDPGDYRLFVTIETGNTREVLTVDILIEIQNIRDIITDPHRDRLYALNNFSVVGFSRSEI